MTLFLPLSFPPFPAAGVSGERRPVRLPPAAAGGEPGARRRLCLRAAAVLASGLDVCGSDVRRWFTKPQIIWLFLPWCFPLCFIF